MKDSKYKFDGKTYAIEVDGEVVPTKNYIMELFMAESCRLDRVSLKSTISLILGVVNLVLMIIILRG